MQSGKGFRTPSHQPTRRRRHGHGHSCHRRKKPPPPHLCSDLLHQEVSLLLLPSPDYIVSVSLPKLPPSNPTLDGEEEVISIKNRSGIQRQQTWPDPSNDFVICAIPRTSDSCIATDAAGGMIGDILQGEEQRCFETIFVEIVTFRLSPGETKGFFSCRGC